MVGRERGEGVKPPCAASPRQWAASSRRVNIISLRVSREQSCHVLLRAAFVTFTRPVRVILIPRFTILYFAEYCEQVHRRVVQLACSRDRAKNWIEACWNSNRGKLHRITVALYTFFLFFVGTFVLIYRVSSSLSSIAYLVVFIAFHITIRLLSSRIYRVERLRVEEKKSKYRLFSVFRFHTSLHCYDRLLRVWYAYLAIRVERKLRTVACLLWSTSRSRLPVYLYLALILVAPITVDLVCTPVM